MMKNTLLYLPALALAALAFLTPARAEPSKEAKAFADKVTVATKFEIDTSELALKYGKAEDVKTFARQMIDDHTKAKQDFQAALKEASIEPPSDMLDATHTAKYAKLRLFTTEKGFDAAYVNEQVKAHEDAVATFREYAGNGQTPALKAFAEKTLPTLEHHLAMIKEIDSKIPKS